MAATMTTSLSSRVAAPTGLRAPSAGARRAASIKPVTAEARSDEGRSISLGRAVQVDIRLTVLKALDFFQLLESTTVLQSRWFQISKLAPLHQGQRAAAAALSAALFAAGPAHAELNKYEAARGKAAQARPTA